MKCGDTCSMFHVLLFCANHWNGMCSAPRPRNLFCNQKYCYFLNESNTISMKNSTDNLCDPISANRSADFCQLSFFFLTGRWYCRPFKWGVVWPWWLWQLKGPGLKAGRATQRLYEGNKSWRINTDLENQPGGIKASIVCASKYHLQCGHEGF